MLTRPHSRDRGYNTAWEKAAATFKSRNPLCLGCLAVGQRVETELVDHVLPHKGDQKIFWDTTMWQPCCRHHHDVVKKMLERAFEVGELGSDDLWLDSSEAVKLSRKYPRALTIGEDGWPIDS